MRILDFLFFLIGRFNLLTSTQYKDLWNELDEDWKRVQDDPTKEGYQDNWKAKAKKWEASPYRRLLLALAALPAVKLINDWMLSTPDEEEPDSDDEENNLPNPLKLIRKTTK